MNIHEMILHAVESPDARNPLIDMYIDLGMDEEAELVRRGALGKEKILEAIKNVYRDQIAEFLNTGVKNLIRATKKYKNNNFIIYYIKYLYNDPDLLKVIRLASDDMNISLVNKEDYY